MSAGALIDPVGASNVEARSMCLGGALAGALVAMWSSPIYGNL